MKNLFFLLIAASFLLTGCVEMADGTSVWAAGKWIVFWLPLLGGIAFMVVAYFSSKSNSGKQLPGNSGYQDNMGNMSIFSLPKFWIGVALIVAAIVFYFMINAER